MINFKWTEEKIGQLKQLHGRGISGTQIAATLSNAIDGPVTRNAVIGKIHRLKLTNEKSWKMGKPLTPPLQFRTPRRKFLTEAPMTRAAAKTSIARTSMNERMGGMGAFKEVKLVETSIDLVGFKCEPVPFLVLTDGLCHWPVGDKFCGQPCWTSNPYGSSTSPYCISHHRLGHRSPAEHTRLAPRR